MSLSPKNTPDGCLPLFEVAEAYAFHLAMEKTAHILERITT